MFLVFDLQGLLNCLMNSNRLDFTINHPRRVIPLTQNATMDVPKRMKRKNLTFVENLSIEIIPKDTGLINHIKRW